MTRKPSVAHAAVAVLAFTCVAALPISVYPGVLNDLLFFTTALSFFIAPIFAVGLVVVLVVLATKGKLHAPRIPWRSVVAGLAILLTTYVLLKLYIPRRVAFALSRSAFEAQLAQAAPSDSGGAPLNSRLGVYRVDEFAADSRGGVYVRVYCGMDGIGPDRMSYGFAHKPNAQGTPFGAAGHRAYRLSGDWYWFRASDDWY